MAARAQTASPYPVTSPIVRVQLSDAGFAWTLKDGKRLEYRWNEIGKTHVDHYSGSWGNVPIGVGSAVRSRRPDGSRAVWVYLSIGDDNRKLAEQCAQALETLAQGVPPETAEEAAQFADIVKRFRESTPKPEFPEEARRFRVQAEVALRDKQFDEAEERYQAALAVAPWWPEGRFNRALVLGEVGRFVEAGREMTKYLALVPDAPNARAAQDKIYEWEAIARRDGRSAAPSSATKKGEEPCRSVFGCAQQGLQR
jgi:tetratricopeptide (TPR) repeat protein